MSCFAVSAVFITFSPDISNANCYKDAAEEYEVPEKLLYSIATVESGHHPYVINYRSDSGGKKKFVSFFPENYEQAVKAVKFLWEKGYVFDLGIGQINSRNMKKFNINPYDLLDSCTNLRWSAFILKDNIERYGFNWKAVSKYNGSTSYSWKVFAALNEK